MQRPLVVLAALGALAGCLGSPAELVLGSTTSLLDAGFLDHLLSEWESSGGHRAVAVVGGTGEILAKARRGDVDILLTHSPRREQALVEEGVASERHPRFYNAFVLAGPASDPAGVAQAVNVTDALARIEESRSLFVSRGDASGTHERELELWRALGRDPARFDPGWYVETGTGQGPTLLLADQRAAYLVLDEATLDRFHSHGRAAATTTLHAGDPLLTNVYALVTLSPASIAHPQAAEAFRDWFLGPLGDAAIRSFQIAGSPAYQAFRPGETDEP